MGTFSRDTCLLNELNEIWVIQEIDFREFWSILFIFFNVGLHFCVFFRSVRDIEFLENFFPKLNDFLSINIFLRLRVL